MKYKFVFAIIALLLLVSFSFYRNRYLILQSFDYLELATDINSYSESPENTPLSEESSADSVMETNESIPPELKRAVPFISQAPFGVWNDFYDEMCEEASMIIVDAWLAKDSRPTLDAQEVDLKLKEISAYEKNRFGTDISTSIGNAKTTLVEFFGLKDEQLQLIDVPNEDTLRKLLNEGLIIAPFSGKALNNPNFRNGGPRYHMLVITGYREDIFITHDVGTRKGAGYEYSTKVILEAMHDFVPESAGDITQGAKTVLLVKDI